MPFFKSEKDPKLRVFLHASRTYRGLRNISIKLATENRITLLGPIHDSRYAVLTFPDLC